MRRVPGVSPSGFALLFFTLGVSTLAAASSGGGSFHYGNVKFEPVDAFACQVEGNDRAKPVTVVILTNFKIDRPAVLAAINTVGALVQQAAAAEHGHVVWVRMGEPGRCGVGGYLSGDRPQELDLGESFSAKTTALTAARVAGECFTTKPGKMFDDSYDFRLSYDVPLTAIPKPTPLPAGGGEPGSSYTALVKAIRTSDWEGAHIRLPADQVPKARPKAADMKNYFDNWVLNYPKTVTVAGGLIKGDVARIEIQGTDHDGRKIKGVVAMKKVDGQWRVEDQSLYDAQ